MLVVGITVDSICRHSGFSEITFVLIDQSFEILAPWLLAQNKCLDWFERFLSFMFPNKRQPNRVFPVFYMWNIWLFFIYFDEVFHWKIPFWKMQSIIISTIIIFDIKGGFQNFYFLFFIQFNVFFCKIFFSLVIDTFSH